MQGLDAQNRLSNAQAVTTTAISTNQFDGVAANRQLGIGEPLAVLLQLDVAADAGNNDETYVVTLETDDAASLASAPVVLATATITRGAAAGSRYIIDLPMHPQTYKRYLGLRYTHGGTSPSATYTAYIMPRKSIEAITNYPNNIISK